MATRKRLELSTSAVTGRRSNQLNYRAISATLDQPPIFRTSVKSATDGKGFSANGGSYRDRTYDPLLVRQMLSQLS